MSVWGKLAERYEGKENQKHKLLALDGGGIRGILTLEILARMKEMLAEATGGVLISVFVISLITLAGPAPGPL